MSVKKTTTEGRTRQRSALTIGAASALALALAGGAAVLVFSGGAHHQSSPPLKPIAPSSAPASDDNAPAPGASEASGQGSLSGMPDFGSISPGSAGSGGPAGAGVFGNQSLGVPAAGGAPVGLPSVPLPPGVTLPGQGLPGPPSLASPPGAPNIDWAGVLAPYVQNQVNATAANIASSITGTAVGSASGAVNSAAVLVGDLILYAAYAPDGQALLNQLESALPSSVAVPAAAALQSTAANLQQAVAPPDFAGLSAAFAQAAAAPDAGALMPQLSPPAQMPPLPTPEQALAVLPAAVALPQLSSEQVTATLVALSAVSDAFHLPPPPAVPLPAPEQVAGALIAMPALALPALPPPPPIGLPPIGLPMPSITRLFGLPF